MQHIRSAQLSDALGIGRVSALSWQHTYKNIFPDEALSQIKSLDRAKLFQTVLSELELSRARSDLIVIESKSKEIIGFSSFGAYRPRGQSAPIDPSPTAEIYAIYLLPEFIGQGLGRLLFQSSLRRLIQMGFQSLGIWAIDTNQRARTFYENLGAKRGPQGNYSFAGVTVKDQAFLWWDLNKTLMTLGS